MMVWGMARKVVDDRVEGFNFELILDVRELVKQAGEVL